MFGKLADRFGRVRSIAIPAGGCSIARLKDLLGDGVKGGRAALREAGVRVAIERRMAPNDEAIAHPGQEVAFLPAFSGG
jgi:molybdopterin converting factor small subunit